VRRVTVGLDAPLPPSLPPWLDMLSKKSPLVLEYLSLSSKNSIASVTPIGSNTRRRTHILDMVPLSTSNSSLRVPDLVMSMAGNVRRSESLRSRMISELPYP